MPDRKTTFIAQMLPYAEQWAKETGIPAQVFLAIMGSETNWGNAGSYFGIKGTGTAGSNTYATHEIVNGQRVNINDQFAAYNSPDEAFQHFMGLISKGRYAPAYQQFQQTGDWQGLLKGINQAGYATDPNWANMIAGMANDISKQTGQQGFGAGLASPTGPEGRTYAQVTGTEYLSDAERQWYLAQQGKSVPATPSGGTPAMTQEVDEFGFPVIGGSQTPAGPAGSTTQPTGGVPEGAIPIPGGGYMVFVPEVGDFAIFMPRTDTITGNTTIEFSGWRAAEGTTAAAKAQGAVSEAELKVAGAKMGVGTATLNGQRYTKNPDGTWSPTGAPTNATGSGSTKLDQILAGTSALGRAAQSQGGGATSAGGGQANPYDVGPSQQPAQAGQPDPLGQGYQDIFNQYGITGDSPGAYPTHTRNAFTGANELKDLNLVTAAPGGQPGGGGSMTQHINPQTLIDQILPLIGFRPTGNMQNDLQEALDIQAYQQAQWAMPNATAASVANSLDFLREQKSAEKNRLLGDLLGVPTDGSYRVGGEAPISFAPGGRMNVGGGMGGGMGGGGSGGLMEMLMALFGGGGREPRQPNTDRQMPLTYEGGYIPYSQYHLYWPDVLPGGLQRQGGLIRYPDGSLRSPHPSVFLDPFGKAAKLKKQEENRGNFNDGSQGPSAPQPENPYQVGAVPNVYAGGASMTTQGPVGIYDLEPGPGGPVPGRPLAVAGAQPETISISPQSGNNVPQAARQERQMAQGMGGGRMNTHPEFLRMLSQGIRRRQRMMLPIASVG